ncbi:hypothetical protein GYMLUDRAFT_251290 [Collybiopsis luxurians FD-317 M1]|uniref:Uncharacterized protein n=1 Tax=Collybiopsis luxurians FD-317 M1 TaxID=944289 RepID=A0A0D0CBR8_9AGAR|nr:hypothetical protein GYMLUDRAFT_251290 [Collybiopsis luxurians FD-317 M1]
MSPSISAIRAHNAGFSPSYLPVAVFVGGTSGIGRSIAEAFARHTKGNAHIVLVGRSRSAAESIITSFPSPSNPNAKHEFIQCDVTLLKNVRQATRSILERHSKINLLILSPGVLSMVREDTEEGIDRSVALVYYSRWTFIHELLPAMVRATEDGEDAKVLSILSAGNGGNIDLDDLGLRNSSLTAAVRSIPTYNDLMMEGFAHRFPSITFIHSYPGWVRTPLGLDSPNILIRVLAFLSTSRLSPLSYIPMSPEDCGEYQLHGILHSASRAGAWRIGKYGDDIGKERGYYCSDEAREKLWNHTVQVTAKNPTLRLGLDSSSVTRRRLIRPYFTYSTFPSLIVLSFSIRCGGPNRIVLCSVRNVQVGMRLQVLRGRTSSSTHMGAVPFDIRESSHANMLILPTDSPGRRGMKGETVSQRSIREIISTLMSSHHDLMQEPSQSLSASPQSDVTLDETLACLTNPPPLALKRCPQSSLPDVYPYLY